MIVWTNILNSLFFHFSPLVVLVYFNDNNPAMNENTIIMQSIVLQINSMFQYNTF